MSNFTGVTFAQQKVLPSDDAIIRRSILSDGFLYGCELSYSGSTLTMAPGQLLACGRQFRHPSSQNWAIVDATSGFARLVLTADLTRTSTKETFDQIVDTIEYASSEDGFPELEQSDINVSGSRYQVVACVVSLGTGGITGIVSQLGPCEVSGGGGLNFSVVGGLTQPADPNENTIWVNTDTEITFYAFQPFTPYNPQEGWVWIDVGESSAVAFNALKKNRIQLYPISAKQYVSGAWVDKTAKSYLGGKWVVWRNGQLYDNGNQYTEVTGGWELAWKGTDDTGSLTLDSAKMVINKQQEINFIRVRTARKINLNGFEKLHMTFTTAYKDPETNDKYWGIQIAIGADNVAIESPNYIALAESKYVQETNKTISVNIPNDTGSQYITISVIGRSIYHVHKVWAD